MIQLRLRLDRHRHRTRGEHAGASDLGRDSIDSLSAVALTTRAKRDASGGGGGLGESYRQIGMLRVQRHLPHDDHLPFQQRSFSVVLRNGGAVVREDDGHLGLVVRWDLVAERRGGEAEPVWAISAVIMLLKMFDWSRTSGYVDGELGHESVVFDGLDRLWLSRGMVKAESKLTSNASTIVVPDTNTKATIFTIAC